MSDNYFPPLATDDDEKMIVTNNCDPRDKEMADMGKKYVQDCNESSISRVPNSENYTQDLKLRPIAANTLTAK